MLLTCNGGCRMIEMQEKRTDASAVLTGMTRTVHSPGVTRVPLWAWRGGTC